MRDCKVVYAWRHAVYPERHQTSARGTDPRQNFSSDPRALGFHMSNVVRASMGCAAGADMVVTHERCVQSPKPYRMGRSRLRACCRLRSNAKASPGTVGTYMQLTRHLGSTCKIACCFKPRYCNRANLGFANATGAPDCARLTARVAEPFCSQPLQRPSQ